MSVLPTCSSHGRCTLIVKVTIILRYQKACFTLKRLPELPRLLGTLKLKHSTSKSGLIHGGTLTEVGSSGTKLTQVLAYEKRPEVKLEKGAQGAP